MRDELTESPAAPERPENEQGHEGVRSAAADSGELRSPAESRTRLLLELFPRDAGASVLPSAESVLTLSEFSWPEAESGMQDSLLHDEEPRRTNEPEMRAMWTQLMTYLDQLIEAVRTEQEKAVPDRDRADQLGSEQPIT